MVAARRLSITTLLTIESLVFATLAAILFLRPGDPGTVRLVGVGLATVAVFAAVMNLNQKQLLQPFARTVGICELCARK